MTNTYVNAYDFHKQSKRIRYSRNHQSRWENNQKQNKKQQNKASCDDDVEDGVDVDGDADCVNVHDDGDAASSGGEEWQAVVDASLARAAAVSKDDDGPDGVASGRRAAAAEFGGWVFASGKRIGRISTTVGNPSSSAPPMYFVACYKHGGSCGKLVHLNSRLDRASCLRWVCSWRCFVMLLHTQML